MCSVVTGVQSCAFPICTRLNTAENPTAIYVDGVLIPDQREGFRDLFDIEQITVLKGPQGTLFGRNATAGVIQISTRAPSFTSVGDASLSYDNYQTLRARRYRSKEGRLGKGWVSTCRSRVLP